RAQGIDATLDPEGGCLVTAHASRVDRRLFWRAIRTGLNAGEAAVSVGMSAHSGWRWFREAGGVPPMPLSLPKTPSRYLELNDRISIFTGLLLGNNYAEIARQLDRATSTVTRELERHRLDPVRPRAKPMPLGRDGKRKIPKKFNYSPTAAQARTDAERQRPKTGKLASCPRLRTEVQNRLKKRHSPQQIAGRLKRDFPDDPEMRVSHETIYRSLYIQGKGALARELTACLRTGRKLRKPRKPRVAATPRCAGVSISQRPPEAADRAVPGHWEGDLIIGAHGRSAIGTIVERRSRFMLLAHLPGDHTAAAVAASVTAQLQQLPDQVKAHTMTWDQGIEMAHHPKIAIDANVQVFFCDPASPWQRPTNENHNGLLRQYFPKGTDLSVHDAEHLAFVADELNDRPRKVLGFRTPREVFYEHLGVA
ncbi:MAG TPA: IS30 family transposase, partial [Microlunatus sp.]|nr:IS30 family transposase [Microlunatus sp.]